MTRRRHAGRIPVTSARAHGARRPLPPGIVTTRIRTCPGPNAAIAVVSCLARPPSYTKIAGEEPPSGECTCTIVRHGHRRLVTIVTSWERNRPHIVVQGTALLTRRPTYTKPRLPFPAGSRVSRFQGHALRLNGERCPFPRSAARTPDSSESRAAFPGTSWAARGSLRRRRSSTSPGWQRTTEPSS